jgi:hypothetical protein
MVSKKTREIELRPDGWERFKTAVAAAAKSGPKHRAGKRKPIEPEAKNPTSNDSEMSGGGGCGGCGLNWRLMPPLTLSPFQSAWSGGGSYAPPDRLVLETQVGRRLDEQNSSKWLRPLAPGSHTIVY